ncbi:MAG: biopolymer transporter ExbD [Gallionellaceae bacterium]|jgi:biopolymer transport protein ExbD|nr:biopolymer transporter ExbD [Gallionellaceae bacterium]
MNFRRGRAREEPEINLIPMIDVLLVILIFMMVTTTYTKFSELHINLPKANGEQSAQKPDQITVSVDANGQYAINGVTADYTNVFAFAELLRSVVGDRQNPVIIISADKKTAHQDVINVMEAARIDGYERITFTTSRN